MIIKQVNCEVNEMEKIILFIFIGISCYLFCSWIATEKMNGEVSKYLKYKNEKYYEKLIKCYEKNKRTKKGKTLKIFSKMDNLIEQIGWKKSMFFNSFTVSLFGIACMILCYHIAFSIFKIPLLSIIISFPTIFFPIVVLSFLVEMKNKKIEKVMLNFLLQLKNNTRINNDIILALKQVKTIEPLQSHIKKFLLEINSGVKFEKAMEHFKEKIPFQKFKMVFTNMQYCYLYGGDFSELLTKNYRYIAIIQKEKANREEETKNARIVLMILILLDLFVYFTFIKNNYENYRIMTKSFLGIVILYWNFISIWFLVVLMQKVKKLDY